MRINQDVRIAVNVLEHMVREFDTQGYPVVAAAIGAPLSFVERIVWKLRKAGLVTVKKGPGGGITGVKAYITLYDVATAMGGLKDHSDDLQLVINDALKLRIIVNLKSLVKLSTEEEELVQGVEDFQCVAA